MRVLLFLLSMGSLWAQPGPAKGSKVPDFEALDQNGSRQSLKSIMGPRGAMLVFFRSADW
ncbi:MAG: hypothetical protein DMG59_26310 [Acidobacteria bacterium]|nr:MAG: hypothetical protein DMG59_26310 [Acidobacteriota bacterium]